MTHNLKPALPTTPDGLGNPAGAVPPRSARISRLERNKRPITVASACFFLLVAAALIGLEVWSRLNARHAQLAQSEVATVNIATATAEHAERSMELIQSLLYDLVERVEQDGLGPAAVARLHNLMVDRVKHTPALQGLFVYDERGRWIVNSLPEPLPGANNSDRAYFVYHQSHLDRTIRIGAPIQSRSSGVWVLPVSRRLEHADGSFAGVALATVKIDYFQQYYDRFDIGRRGAIFLALSDGTVVTRRPLLAGAIGTNIKTGAVFTLLRERGDRGTAMRVSILDRVTRLYSYRRLSSFPIVVGAALAEDEIFAPWWISTMRECLGLAILLAALLYMGRRLILQFLLRDHLEQELRIAQFALEVSNAELDRQARTDALTGLSNRRCLNERMDVEIARACREQTSIALIMLDIDHFKRFNDAYGHVAGDECLRMVSNAIGGQCQRPGDIAARFGGEEFAILMPNTDTDGAVALANRVCQAVSQMALAHAGSPIGMVTLSAGVFALVPTGVEGAGILLDTADKGLYAAKCAGRNQVAIGALGTLAEVPPALQVVRN